MQAAIPAWRDAGEETRAAVCVEILDRLNARSHEIAHAVDAHDRPGVPDGVPGGRVARAGPRARGGRVSRWRRCAACPAAATWEKPQGKRPPLRMLKRFRIVPARDLAADRLRDVPDLERLPGAVREPRDGQPGAGQAARDARCCRSRSPWRSPARCSPRPASRRTWSRSRSTPRATARRPTLARAAGDPADRLHRLDGVRDLARVARDAGASCSPRSRASTASSSTRTDDYQGMLRNLAFSLSLYSGQMCTTPQNLFLPEGGIETDEGHRSFDEVATDLAAAIDGLLGDPKRAAAVLGGDRRPRRAGRVGRGEPRGRRRARVARDRAPRVPRGRHAHAAARRRCRASNESVYARECFGPVAYLVRTGGDGREPRDLAAGRRASTAR